MIKEYHVTCPGYFAYHVVMSCRELPSSFLGSCGKILYTLEANLKRSMRIDRKAKAQFTLIHKGNLYSDPSLMVPTLQNTQWLTKSSPGCLLFDFDTAAVMRRNTISE